MITHLDHVYSYLRDNHLDNTLARAERAGFRIAPNKMRHPAGHFNGFTEMTGSYLEFISVVDEAEFDKEATGDDRLFRAEPGPFSSGAVCLDPLQLFLQLKPRYPTLKPPYSRGETGQVDAVIRWTFCPLPVECTPGCDVFPLKYHSRTGKPYDLKVGKNSIYGMTGLVLCTDSVDKDMDSWEKTLSPVTSGFRREANEIQFGVQKLTWITPAEYQDRFGAPWLKRSSPCGSVAAVKLGAASIDTARSFLEPEGFRVAQGNIETATVAKDRNTGFAFMLERGDPEAFLIGLNQMSGMH